MAAATQIQEAENYKEEGNRHFKEGNYKRALGAYHKVFCYLNGLQAPPERPAAATVDAPGSDAGGALSRTGSSVPSNQIPQEHVENVQKLKQSTRLNMAACYLKVGEHQKCVDACTAALECGSNSKAHFRRGQAFAELRNFSGAKSDLERARELAPGDRGILAELRKLKVASEKGDDKEKQQYAKMFNEGQRTEEQTMAQAPVSPSGTTQEVTPIIEEVIDDGAADHDEASVKPAEDATEHTAAEGRAVSADVQEAAAVLVDPSPPPASNKGSAVVVQPPACAEEARDEARRLDTVVRELTYAWQQKDEEVKIYISFDQCDELKDGVDESRVQVEYAEWSILLVIQSTVEGRTPLGLRLGDFHRRIAPSECKCIVRNSRITLKLVKQVKEHWWNLLQHVPLHAS